MIPAARCAWLLPLLAVVAARAQSQEPRHAASAPGAIDRIHEKVRKQGLGLRTLVVECLTSDVFRSR